MTIIELTFALIIAAMIGGAMYLGYRMGQRTVMIQEGSSPAYPKRDKTPDQGNTADELMDDPFHVAMLPPGFEKQSEVTGR